MKLRTIFIFTLGFAAGFVANLYLTNHINQEVANKLDDVKVLQQAGYIGDQYVDGLEPAKWGE